jgi:Domain of unknown function (DUF4169)
MSGDIVNLRRARKAKQRSKQAAAAAENRLTFGKSKEQRALEQKTDVLARRRFEGHRLETAPDDDAER